MKIINKTKNIVLAEDVVVANTPFKRMKGLLGRKEFSKGQALIIKPCNAIHTFFMRFPLDAVFVNRRNIIIKAYHNLKPWRLSGIFFPAAFCIELPAGVLAYTQTQTQDMLQFQK